MKNLPLFLATTTLLIPSFTSAQIYADIDLSHGGTSLGTIQITLEHLRAPRPVANFIGLASGQRPWVDPNTGEIMHGVPYYDGQIFHRLIHNFVIQGGDPTGTGTGGPGFVIQDQYHPSLRHNGRYILSCAKTGSPNTTGSQFFITLEAAVHLDDLHSIFGTVTRGQNIIDNFTDSSLFPTGAGDVPTTPITMDKVTISGPDFATFDINDPSLALPHVKAQAPCPEYDLPSGTFTLSYPRETQYNYLSYFTTDLNSWTRFRYELSLDSDPAHSLPITGVTFPKFFYRHAAIDYSQVYNPNEALFTSGSTLVLANASGDTVSLVSDGAGAGTWTDSSGGSGSLNNFAVTDSAPATGVFLSSTDQAHFIPLMSLSATFDSPAGAGSWNTINGTISFHTTTNGGFEGSANGGITVNQPFVFTP